MVNHIHQSIKILLFLVFSLLNIYIDYAAAENENMYLEIIPPHETIFADGITDYGFTLTVTDRNMNPVSGEKIELKSSSGKIKDVAEIIAGIYNFSFIPKRTAAITKATIFVQVKESKKSFEIELIPAESLEIKAKNKPEYILAREKESYEIDLYINGLVKDPISQANLFFQTNIGTIKDIRNLGSGRYSVKYVPPPQRYPQTAIILVRAEWEKQYGINWIRIPIYGKTVLTAETESHSIVKIQIADQEFGPFLSGHEGKFEAPIVVPPGYKTAAATVTDESGNMTHKIFDLGIPSFLRFQMYAYPEKILSDGRSRAQLYLFHLDEFGNPSKETIFLTTATGSLSAPVKMSPGRSRAIYYPPNAGKRRKVPIHVHSGELQETAHIQLRPGQFPSHLILEASPETLFADGHCSAKLNIKLYDDYGQGMAGEKIHLGVDKGVLETVIDHGKGVYSAALTAPDSMKEGNTITVTALADVKTRQNTAIDSLRKKISIILKAGKAAKATIKAGKRRLIADGESNTKVFIFATDKMGNHISGDEISVKSTLGIIKNFEYLDNGNYQCIYFAPELTHEAKEKIEIFNKEGALLSCLTIYLGPRPKYYSLGLKGAYLTNFNKISTPQVRLEIGSRLPFFSKQIFLNFEAGYYPESRKDQGIIPALGQYSVDLQLDVYNFSLNGIYKLERFKPFTPYFGFGAGFNIINSRIASSFQSSLVQKKITFAGRGIAGLELKLGPGLGLIELGYDYASLSNEMGVKGNLGGLTTCLGYRYFFY